MLQSLKTHDSPFPRGPAGHYDRQPAGIKQTLEVCLPAKALQEVEAQLNGCGTSVMRFLNLRKGSRHGLSCDGCAKQGAVPGRRHAGSSNRGSLLPSLGCDGNQAAQASPFGFAGSPECRLIGLAARSPEEETGGLKLLTRQWRLNPAFHGCPHAAPRLQMPALSQSQRWAQGSHLSGCRSACPASANAVSSMTRIS